MLLVFKQQSKVILANINPSPSRLEHGVCRNTGECQEVEGVKNFPLFSTWYSVALDCVVRAGGTILLQLPGSHEGAFQHCFSWSDFMGR